MVLQPNLWVDFGKNRQGSLGSGSGKGLLSHRVAAFVWLDLECLR